jgi:hypothetical protein
VVNGWLIETTSAGILRATQMETRSTGHIGTDECDDSRVNRTFHRNFWRGGRGSIVTRAMFLWAAKVVALNAGPDLIDRSIWVAGGKLSSRPGK